MRKGLLTVVVALASTAALFVAHTASAGSGVVGHLYVNDNTGGVNTIAGFDRHADGMLTPMAGSPFVAGGVGTGKGIASQGALQLSGDGRYLLAVDAGSNQISVLRVKPDGSLERVGGGPVDSNGVNPVSIAVHRDLVYVANAGTAASTGGTNYTGFTLNPGGHLRALAGSTVTLPDASQPGDVLFNSDGTKLVGARVNTSLIDSFAVGASGLLDAARAPRSQRRASARSVASSAPPTRASYSSPMRTTVPASARSPRSPTRMTARSTRSAPPRSPTTRPRRAGSRSATTGGTCSPSIPPRRRSPATRSPRAAR